MIDIEKEAAKLVQGWVLNDMNDPHAREALEGRIAALYRRGVAEALEDAAKVCDAVEDEIKVAVRSGISKDYAAAKVVAVRRCKSAILAAIRTRKEEGL